METSDWSGREYPNILLVNFGHVKQISALLLYDVIKVLLFNFKGLKLQMRYYIYTFI